VGTELGVTAVVHLGQLTPDDVQVELYYGKLGTRGDISDDGQAVPMNLNTAEAVDGAYTFSTKVTYENSGQRGLSVRVLPKHGSLPSPFQLRIVRWAQ
jgi:starch phosphorylase